MVVAKKEAGLRVEGKQVTSLADTDVSGLNSLLQSAGAMITPLFGMREDDLIKRMNSPDVLPGEQAPDLSVYYLVLPLGEGGSSRVQSALNRFDESLDSLAEKLRGLDMVEAAYVKPPAEPAYFAPRLLPPGSGNPRSYTPNFEPHQEYLNPAPTGIDARFAWSVDGGTGDGVNIIDIEGGWRFTHEDLRYGHCGVISGFNDHDDHHGTAVIGVLAGNVNSFGITGISPGARVSAVSTSDQPLSRAIRIATDALRAGDIILIEEHTAGPLQQGEQQFGFIAVEWWPAELYAIQDATARGIVVVEAAGNGGQNLDDPVYEVGRDPKTKKVFPPSWKNPFNPANPGSGAVLVGAGNPPPGIHDRNSEEYFGEPYADRARCHFSNYGKRVDAQGWGWEVTTTGLGDLHMGTGADQFYTDLFSGTSSASPFVAGALACVQGILRAHRQKPLDAKQAQNLLRSTGSPQEDGPGFTFKPDMSGSGYPQDYPPRSRMERIGNRPNLRELISRL